MKSLIGVLSLVIVLVYSQAEEPRGCDKTLGPDELHKLEGHWVMVWLGFDKTKSYDDLMPNVTSCHVEIQVQPDNHTLVVHERYVYGGGKCASYTYNLTLPQSHDGHNRLDMVGAVETKDGETKPYLDKATAEFHRASDRSMELVFKSEKYGTDLAVFRKEGQHLYGLTEDHEKHREMAKCLNLHDDNFDEWHYDGSDFCHKKSVLPTLDSNELHQVDGDWVLVWMVFDKTKDPEFPVKQLTSSYMEFDVQSDNHTVVLQERNFVGGKCISYKANLVLPQNSERIHRLDLEGAKEIMDGTEKPFNDIAKAEFFFSSENTVEMFYKSENHGHFLLMYWRYGPHLDHLEEHRKEYKAKAKYLGLSGPNFDEWFYDGEADFCHKKSVLPTLDSDELYQVDGDWVLVWMVYDKTREQDFPVSIFTSSQMHVRVQSDNHTVDLHERNVLGGKCVSYTANLILPQNSEKLHELTLQYAKEIVDGVETLYNDTGTAYFLQSAENTMEMFHKSNRFGPYLLVYKKEGHHQDAKDLKKDYEEFKEKAIYMGMSKKNMKEWVYDGAADFCPKNSAPES